MEDFTSKIETLIRLGLIPIEDLPYLKKALGHVKSNMFLPVQERRVFYKFVNDILKITLDSPALLRLIMNKTGALKHVNESVKKKKKFTLKGDKRTDNGPSSIGDIQNAPPTGYEETDMLGQKLIEHVRKRGNKYVVTNESGNKTLGTHPTRGAAVKQLQAIEAHKHMDESSNPDEDWNNPFFRHWVDTGGEYHPNDPNHPKNKKKVIPAVPKKEKPFRKHMDESVADGRVLTASSCPKCGKKFTSSFGSNSKLTHTCSTKKEKPFRDAAVTGNPRDFARESVELKEEVNVRKLPTNTLRAYASILSTKKKNGGRITMHDKTLASLAKKELTRRRNMGESVDYTERFDAALTHFGVKDIDDLDIETTKDFLKFVDTQNEMVISANSQKKLPVSDAHKERAAQDMLARAHMKDRLMAKASAEYKDAIKPKEKSDARKLFMKDRKVSKVLGASRASRASAAAGASARADRADADPTIRSYIQKQMKKVSESVVVEDAGSRNATSPICTYCGGKLQTTKENHKTQGHSGKCTNCGKTN